MREVLEAALAAERRGDPAALVTVIATRGSTPQKAGAKMLVLGDGRLVGTIGGGCMEAEMIRRARMAIELGETHVASYELTPDQAGEDGLVCGGRMEVLIEPVEPEPALAIFGAGHVAQPLARLAHAVGFRVEVADDRPRYANAGRFPDAAAVVVAPLGEAAAQMTIRRGGFAVVVTRGHRGDAAVLETLLGRGLRYVGLLGSRPKLVHVLEALRERGVPSERLAEVRCPIGIEIGARTPEEIAVSVVSELIAVRHRLAPDEIRPMRAELSGRLRVGP